MITNNDHRTVDFGKTHVKSNVENPNQVYVKNIPFTVSSSALEVIFEEFGSVTKAHVISQKVKDVKGKSIKIFTGEGLITFSSAIEAQAALREDQ